ncbi:carbohydrate-binding protein [Paraburkholderia aspalathi]|uniref:carbohydrate-binding protein n=1 Tax=Paraburkholderia aspalathi TaxID=1324617 RepID=UPI0038BC262C
MNINNCLVAASLLIFYQTANAEFSSTQWGVHISNFTGSVPQKPKDGFRNLTYPINVASGPLEEKFYYSQYVSFNNPTAESEGFYYGIQPQGNGTAQVIFSYFGKGARVIDTAHCSTGADGGNGVSCNKVKIPFRLGVIYNFNAILSSESATENSWEGSVTDTSTNIKTDIGAWTTPKAIGYLSGSSIGFIEDYVGIRSCAEIPATSAYFGPGASQISASVFAKGSINAPYKVGVCSGNVNISSQVHDDGGRTIIQGQGQDLNTGGNTTGSSGSGSAGGTTGGTPPLDSTWSASQTYTVAMTVTYQGVTYQAQWWTRGDVPGQSTAWKAIGDGVPTWSATAAYAGGSCVMYQGAKYCAKWWTQNNVPSTGDVWVKS